MGVKNVLTELKCIMEPAKLERFKGSKMAIDGNLWLHKGARTCSKELVMGQKTDGYIEFVVEKANYLKKKNIEPIFVFDGMKLPIKEKIKGNRTNKKQNSLKKAKDALELNADSEKALTACKKAVSVTKEMIYRLTRELKQKNIQYIVAPYEADAQLAYMAINEEVEVVVTNDSDLILFGCPKIIFGMGNDGDGYLYCASQLKQCLYFHDFTLEMLIVTCLFSGCDYVHGVMDLTEARNLTKSYKTYQKVFNHLKEKELKKPPKKASRLPEGYEDNFVKAYNVFKYATVFDSVSKKAVPLSPITEELKLNDDLDFLGPTIEPQTVQRIALGEIDPTSKEPFQMIYDEEDNT